MTGVPEDDSPATAAVTGAVSLLTLVAAFGLLAFGWPYFWIAFPIGFGGLLPAAVALTKWYSADDNRESVTTDQEDALASLRERYARGEIDDREFERRVERLLETESLESAEAAYGDQGPTPDRQEREQTIQRERETERS